MNYAEAIKLGAAVVGGVLKLINLVLDGRPVAEVRKDVLAQVEHDARDQTDETDDLSDVIDNASGPPEPPGASER